MDEFDDDTRMKDLAVKYPEYNDMGLDNLDNEYDNLSRERLDILRNDYEDPNRLDEIIERKDYLERLLKRKQEEDRQTVTIDRSKTEPRPVIRRKEQRSRSDPEVRFDIPPDVESINPNIAIQDFIQRNYNIENFRFNQYDETAIDLQLNIDTTSRNNIRYKPKTTEGRRGAPQIVLKNDSNGVLQFNDATVAKRAVEQFKQEIRKIIDRDITTREMPMVDTSVQINDIPGLTPTEMKELRGVLYPPENIDPRTRRQFLQIQADQFKGEIDKTRARMNELDSSSNVDDAGEYIDLQERLNGLTKARDDTLRQKELEEVREEQEEDISRLQKFKKWAKENMVGLTALSVSIAGLLTTIIVGARKAIVAGAQATSRFGKAIADLGKKLWPLLAPILSIIGTAISLGAKGLLWLASNLWVLAIAFAWFIYDQYKQKRNKT